MPQLLSDHPPARVAVLEPPFTHTGIYYYGPFLVSTRICFRSHKVWGVIFTCLTCRAVHLDIVDSLSMDACLNVIECFMSQYADVTIDFYSDNGINLHGTHNAIKRMFNKNSNGTTVLKESLRNLILLLPVHRVEPGSVLYTLSGNFFLIYVLTHKPFLYLSMI